MNMRLRHFAFLAAVGAGTVISIAAAQGAAQTPPSPDQLVANPQAEPRGRREENCGSTSGSRRPSSASRAKRRRGSKTAPTTAPTASSPRFRSARQPAKAEAPDRGGRSGRLKERVVENKKDEMQEYMQKAVALVHKYVPPFA
jgi:hypothetical protein